jgi:hypothetical protein
MTRQDFFRLFLGFGTTATTVTATADITTHGDKWCKRMAVPRNPLIEVSDCRTRRYIPGMEILFRGEPFEDCWRAERYADGSGRVFYYVRDRRGSLLLAGGDVAWSIKSGEVEIVPPPGIRADEWSCLMRKWVSEDDPKGSIRCPATPSL